MYIKAHLLRQQVLEKGCGLQASPLWWLNICCHYSSPTLRASLRHGARDLASTRLCGLHSKSHDKGVKAVQRTQACRSKPETSMKWKCFIRALMFVESYSPPYPPQRRFHLTNRSKHFPPIAGSAAAAIDAIDRRILPERSSPWTLPSLEIY